MRIVSFGDKSTREFYESGRLPKGKGWQSIGKVALRKLDMISFTSGLGDLKVPPRNKLEALKGSLEGFYSIRINRQWRVIFRYTDIGAEDVQIVDYHR